MNQSKPSIKQNIDRLRFAIGQRWRRGILYRVYNPRDELGKGRFCMLLSALTAGLATNLSSGLFYTGFLLGYGINIVNIAIITFIPSITSLLNIFSPWILEHFKRRKFILAAGKLTYYTINLVGVTLLPILVKDPDARLTGFILIVILSNSINALFSSGYSAWHANFLPDSIRMDYFSATGCINSFVMYLVVLGVAVITDSLEGSPDQLTMIMILRFVAYGLAIVDCLILLIPKEFPYTKSTRIKLTNIFTLPVKNRRFLLTVLICAGHGFGTSLPHSLLPAYVLKVLSGTGLQYTLPSAIDSTYFLFFIMLTAFWKRYIAKHYWFRSYSLFALCEALTYFAYSFVNSTVVWLYIVVRLSQHVFGCAVNPIVGSLPYVNMPDADRTNYFAFYTIVTSIANFSGMMLGTLFTKMMDNGTRAVEILGYSFSSTQILLFGCAAMRVITSLYAFFITKKVTPPDVVVQKA